MAKVGQFSVAIHICLRFCPLSGRRYGCLSGRGSGRVAARASGRARGRDPEAGIEPPRCKGERGNGEVRTDGRRAPSGRGVFPFGPVFVSLYLGGRFLSRFLGREPRLDRGLAMSRICHGKPVRNLFREHCAALGKGRFCFPGRWTRLRGDTCEYQRIAYVR